MEAKTDRDTDKDIDRERYLVGAAGVDAVLVADDLPELGADLVTALAGLGGKGMRGG